MKKLIQALSRLVIPGCIFSFFSIPTTYAQRSLTILPGGTTDELVRKIQTGRIQLSDIPLFISSFIELGILLAGSIAFIMILVGGYQYIIGGVYSDMREKGKTTLTYAISGFILCMLAYAIVTLVQLAATSF
ncbi:MAG: hypothetical protein Q8O95_00960 [bacterium]|nr:hypothetical protein [bacterium]